MQPGLDALDLPPAIRRHVLKLAKAELTPASQLADEVTTYLTDLRQQARSREFIDLGTADLVGRVCRRLVGHLDGSTPEGHHRLVQAAVRYFVLPDDADNDIDSPIGFDDDLRVACGIARGLEWADVVELCQERE